MQIECQNQMCNSTIFVFDMYKLLLITYQNGEKKLKKLNSIYKKGFFLN